jgi:Mg/Co/Ni transporter MgtE
MAAQRRIDLVLDSVRRLLRVGATANLLNLLQKQHPADLAQVFKELTDRDREASFSLLADRHGRLAMEAISELGPRRAPRCWPRGRPKTSPGWRRRSLRRRRRADR